MEILFWIFTILLIVSLLALLIVPIWYGIKQARSKSNDHCESHSVNITIIDPQSKEGSSKVNSESYIVNVTIDDSSDF